MTNQNTAFHLPADTGRCYCGPGDRYTFLVTGAQTNGGYFIMEAIIPPGGGPPRHIHHREEESLYLLEGILDITLGEKKVKATTGDFVQIPRGTIHAFLNAGCTTARMLLFSRLPAWINISRKCWNRVRTAPLLSNLLQRC